MIKGFFYQIHYMAIFYYHRKHNLKKNELIGFCFGGLAAIELARSGYQLSGCVSFHGLLNQSDEPFQKVNTKLLILHGDKDPMVSADQILALQDEMTKSDIENWSHILDQLKSDTITKALMVSKNKAEA